MFKKIAVSAGLLFIAALWFAPELVGSANGQTSAEAVKAQVQPVVKDGATFFGNFRLSLASAPRTLPGGITEDEAAKIAMARGAAIRTAREQGRSLTESEIAEIGEGLDRVDAAALVQYASLQQATPQPEPLAAVASPARVDRTPLWTVTGSTVNLRSGPGTGHGVVATASQGETYRPLSDTASSWIEIELADGSSAWIYAKFLAPAGG
ncbi:MAG: SH3 domain-containing protein [Pseudomonadota bacterium]